jgi:hypothetical protein
MARLNRAMTYKELDDMTFEFGGFVLNNKLWDIIEEAKITIVDFNGYARADVIAKCRKAIEDYRKKEIAERFEY